MDTHDKLQVYLSFYLSFYLSNYTIDETFTYESVKKASLPNKSHERKQKLQDVMMTGNKNEY